MKAQSMTGFSKVELEDEVYSLNVEVKSVNHRFKDIRFKMGNVFNAHEINFRKKLESIFKRGSFDIYIGYNKNQNQALKLDLDYTKINSFLEDFTSETKATITVNPSDFLRGDFYKEDEQKEENLTKLASEALEKALISLKENREEEGAGLVKVMEAHLSEFKRHFETVRSLKGSYQDKVKTKLFDRFKNELGSDSNIDEGRFQQEVIYFLEKLDIDEEINRIEIHLKKLTALLSNEEEVGRQIDFLIQELNRETNTIGSKSAESEISESVVQMKVQLEKMREQGLNLQ